jgi:hypothetical protein
MTTVCSAPHRCRKHLVGRRGQFALDLNGAGRRACTNLGSRPLLSVFYRTDEQLWVMQCPHLFLLIQVYMDIDRRLSAHVAEELKRSPGFSYVLLSVRVENGTVTISGHVNSLAERRAVERAAKRVAGIHTLVLEIRAAVFPIVRHDLTAY